MSVTPHIISFLSIAIDSDRISVLGVPRTREALLWGGLYVTRLNFKPFHVTVSEGLHVAVAISSETISRLIQRTLENLLTEECSCSGKTTEKQIKTRFTLEKIVPDL